ncbi:hypothetical protein J7T55_008004 [Diaporthe amygdali]|uniref:uncharacterized protein n=1 Tax=Phomopsis amygdali TaxID=1214568 RepID=UPI0022FF3851|nr:uncharacterized protein J7T55_008004 [Diaporthe amygdali]KAJ0114169.1 hypothetical protein J7T55_008004 [Diaporthe amygdali]
MPASHVVEPRKGYAHTHTIILLHGRDSTSAEFASELFESEASALDSSEDSKRTLPDLLPTIRWVFPTAPMLRSARFDTDMSQWFDMWSTENPDERPEVQLPGLKDSVSALVEVVREEERDVARDRIFIGGISQGFVVAVAAFFAGEAMSGLAGLIGLSSWMPLSGELGDEDGREQLRLVFGETSSGPFSGPISGPRSPVPVFLGHSSDDPVVSVSHGRALRDTLKRFSDIFGEVEWHEYEDGGHWLNEPQGVDDLVAFLKKHMNAVLSA